jgi:hypothetical protein
MSDAETMSDESVWWKRTTKEQYNGGTMMSAINATTDTDDRNECVVGKQEGWSEKKSLTKAIYTPKPVGAMISVIVTLFSAVKRPAEQEVWLFTIVTIEQGQGTWS